VRRVSIVVKDLKGYRDKTDAKPASSPGWFILIFSHMAILVLGISLGYWIGGRFSKDSMNQKTVTPEVATRNQERPKSTATTKETQSERPVGVGKTKQKQERVPDGGEGRPRFTFYESLPKEVISDTDVSVGRERKEREGPPDDTSPKGSVPQPQPRQGTKGEQTVAYYVQVASFREREMAWKLRDDLKKKGYAARVAPAVVKDKGIWYRVRLGPFGSKTDANQKAQAVKRSEKLQPLVLIEKGEEGP
jgi:cell division protein FtsN